MVLDRFVVEINHHYRNARRFKTWQFAGERLVLHFRDNQHVWLERQRFFQREGIADDVTHIGDVFQLRHFGGKERPAARIEFLPKFARNADDVFEILRAGRGDIVGVIEGQNGTLDRHIDLDFTRKHVSQRFHFGSRAERGESGKERRCFYQVFQHLLSSVGKNRAHHAEQSL